MCGRTPFWFVHHREKFACHLGKLRNTPKSLKYNVCGYVKRKFTPKFLHMVSKLLLWSRKWNLRFSHLIWPCFFSSNRPSGGKLEQYISHMGQIQDAMDFFSKNNPSSPELSKAVSILSFQCHYFRQVHCKFFYYKNGKLSSVGSAQ